MTIFEIVSDALMKAQADGKLENLNECVIYWNRGDKYAAVNFPMSTRQASRVCKLEETHPDEVKAASKKDGVLVATVPVRAIKLNIVDRELTDEQREELKERLVQARNDKQAQTDCT